jgi:hypothetical protein
MLDACLHGFHARTRSVVPHHPRVPPIVPKRPPANNALTMSMVLKNVGDWTIARLVES